MPLGVGWQGIVCIERSCWSWAVGGAKGTSIKNGALVKREAEPLAGDGSEMSPNNPKL
jgi:hypothetical protein